MIIFLWKYTGNFIKVVAYNYRICSEISRCAYMRRKNICFISLWKELTQIGKDAKFKAFSITIKTT